MSNKLKGTAEQFMHSTYLITRLLQINSDNSASGADDDTINVADIYSGEDGLVQELVPYGLAFGKMVDKVWDEVDDFPGVPAYELSDNVVAEWLHSYIVSFGYLPLMDQWKQYCKNVIRVWCEGKLEAFGKLPILYQTDFCVKEVDVFKLWSDAQKIKEVNSEQLDPNSAQPTRLILCSDQALPCYDFTPVMNREHTQPKVSHVKTCIHSGDLVITEELNKTTLQFNGLEVKIDGKITDVNGPGLDV